MKQGHKSFLSRLDDSIRWTGFPERVADDMTGETSHRQRLMRWIPLLMIVFSCAALALFLVLTIKFNGTSPERMILPMTGLMVPILGSLSLIHSSGPLGRSSLEDDEREAALRRSSWFVCLGLLAVINGVGQPILLALSHWQGWQFPMAIIVAVSTLFLNAVLLGTVPTLYASWKLPKLPRD